MLEQCLLETRRDQDARLRRRYDDLAIKSTDLLVNREGYVLVGDSVHPKPFDVPESGGEITMGDGSVAVAEPLGRGEAYLLRRRAPPRARAARAGALERAEGRVHEQAREHAARRHRRDRGLAVTMDSGRTSIESDQRVSAYFEAALDCVIMADASGRMVEFNPAAERTFGYSRDEALGRTIAELIVPPSLRARHSVALARFIETGRGTMLGRRLELTAMRADGSEFPVELALSQVEAEPVLICGALRDISAAKKAETHLRELAEEQAALRRVAMLVAGEAAPQLLFEVVSEEVARIVNVPLVRLLRYEPDGAGVELIGGWGESVDPIAVGRRWRLDGPGLLATVWETGRSARRDDYTDTPGEAAVVIQQAGMRSAVASPIIVEGRLWGAISVFSRRLEPLPEDTEARLADFTELAAAAIANAESRGELAASEGRARKLAAELAASRARVIAAGDETRRRIERDLHDGAQQRLVALVLGLRSAERRVPAGLEDLRTEVGRFADQVTSVFEELREMSRGIHPAILTEGGLSPALEALALRSPVPVKLNARCERRLPDGIEVAAYYVVSEALTNAAKHANASRVQIDLHVEEETLYLSIVDDGVGGADSSGGSGLIGLKDRVEALGGTIDVASPPGSGTRLDVGIPLLQDPPVASNSEPLSRVLGPSRPLPAAELSSGSLLQLGQ